MMSSIQFAQSTSVQKSSLIKKEHQTLVQPRVRMGMSTPSSSESSKAKSEEPSSEKISWKRRLGVSILISMGLAGLGYHHLIRPEMKASQAPVIEQTPVESNVAKDLSALILEPILEGVESQGNGKELETVDLAASVDSFSMESVFEGEENEMIFGGKTFSMPGWQAFQQKILERAFGNKSPFRNSAQAQRLLYSLGSGISPEKLGDAIVKAQAHLIERSEIKDPLRKQLKDRALAVRQQGMEGIRALDEAEQFEILLPFYDSPYADVRAFVLELIPNAGTITEALSNSSQA